jgi:PAS domain S-box-containing protein
MLPGELSVAEAIAALAAAERDWAVVGSSGQGVITHRELLRAQPDDRLQDVVAVGMPLTLADLAQPEALSTKVGDRDYVLVVGAQGECLGVWERHRWQLLQQGYELWHNQTIASLMNPQVVTMPPEWSLAQARDFLAQEGATWAMVASPATPRLALGWVSWQALWQPGATVQEVMQPPRFLPATLPLSQAIRHWQEWVLVTDAAGLVVGSLTPRDWERYGHPLTLWQRVADLQHTIQQQAGPLQSLTTNLRRNQERFAALLRHCGDVVLVVNAQGIMTYCSPAVPTVLGYRPDDLLGQSFLTFVHGEDRQAMASRLHPETASGGFTTTAFRWQRRDGTWCVLEAVGNPQYADPSLRGMVLNLRDVTEQRQTLQLLRAKHAELRGIFQALPDRYFRLDERGYICDCLDTCPENQVGQWVGDVLPPVARAPLVAALEQMQQGAGFAQFQYQSQGQTWVARLVPLPEQQMILALQDVTPQSQLETALRAIVQIQQWLLAAAAPQEVYDQIV